MLAKSTGLQLALANTILFIQPAGSPPKPSGAAGDLDFLATWTLIGRDTEDTGRFVASVEYRDAIGPQPPSIIGRQIDALIPVTNGFNDRGLVLRDPYWIQRFFEARLRILIGRGDPSSPVGAQGAVDCIGLRLFARDATSRPDELGHRRPG